MSTTETLTRALLSAIDTSALESAIVDQLQRTYTPEELSAQLKRAAELLGCENPTEAIALQVTQRELDALRTVRDMLAPL